MGEAATTLPPRPAESALRLAAAAIAWTAAAVWIGREFVELCLPLYQAVLDVAVRGAALSSLAVVDRRGEIAVLATFRFGDGAVFAGLALPGRGEVTATTLGGHVLVESVMVLTLATGWPWRRWQEGLAGLACAVPAMLAVAALDVPFMLLGALTDLVFASLAPERFSLAIAWMRMLDGGGRFVLALCAGAAAVAAARWLAKPAPRTWR